MTGSASSTPSRSEKAISRLIALAGFGLMLIILWLARHFVYDDALISLRYAKNFAEHGQLVWNLGEYVEGYTNFLFVILSAGLIAVGLPPTAAAQALALLAFAAIVVATIAVLRRLNAGPIGLGLGFAAVVGSISLPAWAMSGMEATLVAALITGTLLAAIPLADGGHISTGRIVLAGVLGSLAYLTRMDAVVPIAVVVTMLALTGASDRGTRFKAFLIVTAIGLIVVTTHLLWRFYYYDSLMPNTYYAKVGVPWELRFEFGVHYILITLAQSPFLVLSLLVSFAALVTGALKGAERSVALTCITAVLAQMAYVYYSGGDHLPAGRFFAPVLPLAAIALGISVRVLSAPVASLASGITFAAAAFAAVVATPRIHGGAEAGLVVGEYIRQTIPVDQTIALNVAGASPFVAEDHNFIDMLGLNDATVGRRTDFPVRAAWQRRPGHAKGDGAYILERAPDIIIVGGADGSPIEDALFLGEFELAELDEFHACYELRKTTIPAADSNWHRIAGGDAEVLFQYYQRTCPP